MSDSPQKRYVIGYAIAPKKEHSFMQPSLAEHAKQRGIDLVRLNPNIALFHQGPLDCVIHKLYDEDWKQKLNEFHLECPDVPVIDSPESIERLHNRVSMLEVVSQLNFLVSNTERFDVPKQVLILDSGALNGEGALGDLEFPVIAKPLEANGSAKSHEMFLVFDHQGMNILQAPVVLQEFVNHGGVVFKVYVAGEHAKCVKRRSLPDISEEKLGSLKGSVPFSQISNLPTLEDGNEGNEYCDTLSLETAEMPPSSFLIDLAKALREAMGLSLFNFDLIRDAKDPNRYLIIDINYFPGYAKMPSYESLLTDFFWDMVNKKSLGGNAAASATDAAGELID